MKNLIKAGAALLNNEGKNSLKSTGEMSLKGQRQTKWFLLTLIIGSLMTTVVFYPLLSN